MDAKLLRYPGQAPCPWLQPTYPVPPQLYARLTGSRFGAETNRLTTEKHMAQSLTPQELAHAAAQGVAIALTAQSRQAGEAKAAHTDTAVVKFPPKLIFGGPGPKDLFEVTFAQHGGVIQAGNISPAKNL